MEDLTKKVSSMEVSKEGESQESEDNKHNDDKRGEDNKRNDGEDNKRGEDSDDSFHSAASEDDEPIDTTSSVTDCSEPRLNPVLIKPDDDTDSEDQWMPADQHTPKTSSANRRRKHRRRRDTDDEEEEIEEDKRLSDREEEDRCSKEKTDTPKEDTKEDEEEDYIDEEHLKDLEVTMTEEERNTRREESQKSKEAGNVNFKSGNHIESVWDYTAGLRTCPLAFPRDRAVLYGNRAAAKAKLERRKPAIRDCGRAIELDESYTKVILRRATLLEEDNQLDEALKDYQRVIELDPSCQQAQYAVRKLPDMINERNEKLKEEMLGKLKDLGNMFLRPFGLSTSNFQMNQDPNGSGSYNISFNQNANQNPPNS